MKDNFKENILIGSGLSALGFLEKNYNSDFLVYEKNDYFGGHAFSHNLNGFFFDEGAHISHSKNSFFLNFFSDEIKNSILLKSNVVNFKKNRVIGYPIQTNLKDLSFSEKLNILKDLFKTNSSQNYKNYYDWLVNSYGSFLTENYYNIYTKKYWRTHPNEMSANWIEGRLAQKDTIKTLYSMFFKTYNKNISYNSFRYPLNGGFFNFFEKKYQNKKINLNSLITRINLKKRSIIINNKKEIFFNKLISSIPLVDYLILIPELDEEFKLILGKLKYTKLITFNFKIKKQINYDFHWCYFYDEELETSRMSIINNYNQIINKDDFFIVQMEVFRRNDESFDLEEISKKVKMHLFDFFKIKKSDIFFEKHIIVNKAYPIPLLNTEEHRLCLIEFLKKNDIFQIGLYGKWKYMWSDQSFLDGYNFQYL